MILLSIEFIQLAKDCEDIRKKWQRTDHELGKYKDLLMKAETECSALDVKLKHARNQVDVEIKRRQRAEANCEKLVCIVFHVGTMDGQVQGIPIGQMCSVIFCTLRTKSCLSMTIYL